MDRLASVILFVADLPRSMAFYRDVIGLPFRLHGDGYAEFATGDTKFALYDAARLPELTGRAAAPGGGAEILFLVDDVDREADRLRAAGARILTGPVDRPWGHRTLHVEDPDGHIVELAQPIERSEPPRPRRTSVTVGIPVRSLPDAVRWYAAAFDVEPSLEPLEGSVEFEVVPGAWLQLYEGEPAGDDHVFRVGTNDLAAGHARLAGLAVDVGPIERFEGVIAFCDFADPDGNRLSLYEVL